MRPRSSFTSLALALLILPGCSLFYRNSHRGSSFTLYSDRSPELLARVGQRVERIYEGYTAVFGIDRSRLGRTRIILEGQDSDVLDLAYAPSILGYYLPMLNYIEVDTASVLPQGEEMLDQVLLHEVAHHFIVTEFPAASERCWLNEGLAGALEATVFDDQAFEVPLLNPVLFSVAQRQAFLDDMPRVRDIVALDWSRFHAAGTKERNYALAWSLVYFILEHHLPAGKPLGERLETLYHLAPDHLDALTDDWQRFLRGFDMTGRLLRLAAAAAPHSRLTARWATRQLGAVRLLDERRALHGLAGLFDDPDEEKRRLAYSSFVRKLESISHSFILDDELVRGGLERAVLVLADPSEPSAWRAQLTRLLEGSPRTRDAWIPGLVHLLADGDGELRAAAARTLSRVAAKPTIINPAFWRRAPEAERSREVAEWRSWLARGNGR
jgi:hypothetical protein